MARTVARVKADRSQHRVRADKPVPVAAARVAPAAQHRRMRNPRHRHCIELVDEDVNEHGRKRRHYRCHAALA